MLDIEKRTGSGNKMLIGLKRDELVELHNLLGRGGASAKIENLIRKIDAYEDPQRKKNPIKFKEAISSVNNFKGAISELHERYKNTRETFWRSTAKVVAYRTFMFGVTTAASYYALHKNLNASLGVSTAIQISTALRTASYDLIAKGPTQLIIERMSTHIKWGYKLSGNQSAVVISSEGKKITTSQ